MKRFYMICTVIVLCMLAACKPSGESAAETPAPTAKDEKEAALLYAGERINLYYGRTENGLGICIEELNQEDKVILYQAFPETAELDSLSVSEIHAESDGEEPETHIYIHYIDADGKTRAICLYRHDYVTHDVFSYPVSETSGMTQEEKLWESFADIMLIGYLYENFQSDYAKNYSDDWEPLCQRRILDALYISYGDALPPYLRGEGETYDERYHLAFVTQEELDGFFRSTVNRPNLVPDRMHIDEEVPELLPGQVPMWPTDWVAWAHVSEAVPVSDGEYLLYGYAHIGNTGFYPQGVICRVIAVDDYLGWRVVNTELINRPIDMEKTTAHFVPAP